MHPGVIERRSREGSEQDVHRVKETDDCSFRNPRLHASARRRQPGDQTLQRLCGDVNEPVARTGSDRSAIRVVMKRGLPGENLWVLVGTNSRKEAPTMLHAGLDLSRKRLDVRVLDDA